MKSILEDINKKIKGNIGLFCVIGFVCVLGIITSTLGHINKQTGDVRGDSTYLTPTGSCAACDCTCICAGDSGCLTSCNSTCTPPTATPVPACPNTICTGVCCNAGQVCGQFPPYPCQDKPLSCGSIESSCSGNSITYRCTVSGETWTSSCSSPDVCRSDRGYAYCENPDVCHAPCNGNCQPSECGSCSSTGYTCNGTFYSSGGCNAGGCGNGWSSTNPGGAVETCTASCGCCGNSGPTCYRSVGWTCNTTTWQCVKGTSGTFTTAASCAAACVRPVCQCNPSTQATICVGSSYTETGDGICIARSCPGTKNPSCACAANTCSGSTCADGCGGTCPGTKQPDCGGASSKCGSYLAPNACGSCSGSLTCNSCQMCSSNSCVSDPSKVIAGTWSSWSSCSSCQMTRTCNGAQCGGTCSGSSTQSCGTVNGGWSAWSPATCTVQCGQTQTRSCNNPAPACGGTTCTGLTTQTCSNFNTGIPAQVVIVSPNGTSANPTAINTGNNIVSLNWVKDASGLNPYYHIEIYDSSNALVSQKFVDRVFNTVDTDALLSNQVYHWRVRAANDVCALAGFGTTTYYGAWSSYGYFRLNQAPAFGDFVMYNSIGNATLTPQSGNKNHICQAVLMESGLHSRKVVFQISITDPNGGTDIKKVSFRLRNGTTDYVVATYDNGTSSITGTGATFYTPVTTTVSGNARSVNFPILFVENFNTALYGMQVYAQDFAGIELPVVWTDTNRFFKVWNCKVKVRGTLYDGSTEPFGPVCPDNGFTNPAGSGSNFTSLVFKGVSPATDQIMSVNPPFYLSNGNDLTINMTYNPQFSSLAGTNPIAKITDIGSGATTSTCASPIFLSGAVVSPYSDSPELQIDFSSILNQESWFQTVGGGVNSKSVITDNVPVTCQYDSQVDPTKKCQSVVSVDSLVGTTNPDSGLIAGSDIKNVSGCGNACQFGLGNNWGIKKDVIGESYGYKYFYDRYYTGLKQGTVLSGDTNLSAIAAQTGVIFINGSLNIDTNKTVNQGEFVMFVVKNNINFANTVTKADGIFIADGQITAGQKNDSQLTINGILYSPSSKISLTRSYNTKEFNNISPAVVVKYRPDFIFSMPGKLVKVLSGWKEGQ